MSRVIFSTLAAAWLTVAAVVAAEPADDQFAIAASHYSRQRWQAAADEFRALLETYPAFGRANDVRFYFAESLVQLEQYEAARAAYEQLLQTAPDYRFRKQALFRQGEAEFLLKQRAAAKRTLGNFQKQYPDDGLNAYASSYLGELALLDDDPAGAREIYTLALAKFPDGPMADPCRFGLGRALELQGDATGAKRFYTLLIQKPATPLAGDAQLQMALLHYHAGEFAEAVARLKDFDRQFPNSNQTVAASYWLGMSQFGLERWEQAAAALLRVAEAGGRHELVPAALFHAAEAHERLGQLDAAHAACQRIVDQWPDSEWADDALETRVRLAFDASRDEQVVGLAAMFERYADSPLLPRVRQWQARALLRQNRASEAVVILESVRAERQASGHVSDNELKLDSATNDYLLGLAYLGSRRFDDAIQQFNSPFEGLSPEMRGGVLLGRAQAWFGQEDFMSAIKPLQGYLDQFADSPQAEQARHDLVLAQLRSEQFDEALKTVDTWPQAAASTAARSESLLRREVSELSRVQLQAASTTARSEALLLVAEACYETKRLDDAVRIFQRLAEEADGETRARALSGLGWARFQADEEEAAAEAFSELAREFPNHRLSTEARLMQARAFERQGRHDAALDLYERLIHTPPTESTAAEALFAAARLHEQQGRMREAIVLHERLINEHADWQRLDVTLYQLAWDLDDLGEADTADTIFLRLHQGHASSPYWADATYRLAERAARADDGSRARELVDLLLDSPEQGEIRRHALYLAGQLAAHDHRWKDVRLAMERLLDEFPESELQVPAEYWLAESLFRLGEFTAAMPRLESLFTLTEHRRDPWMAMIPLRYAQLLAREKQWPRAYEVATSIPQRFDSVPQRYELDYVLGRCHVSRAELDEARAAFARVVRSPDGRRTEVAAMADWMTGETYFLQKRYDEAIKAYHRVETLYAYPRWQAAALLQAAKCHELTRRPDQAARLYRQVIDEFPTTSFAEQAAARLRATRQESSP